MDIVTPQKITVKAALADKNIWIAGIAGAGKTQTLKASIMALRGRNKIVIATAPTTMAATMIDGMTLHRALGLPVRPLESKDTHAITLSDKIVVADVIAIDEIGMVRRDTMDLIGEIVRLAREERKLRGLQPTQLIVSGGFSGLPPVLTQRDRMILKSRFENFESPYAFESPAWRELETHVLDVPMRQARDPDFADTLELVRTGDPRCLAALNRLADRKWPPGAVSLAFTNREADRANRSRMERLDGPLMIYEGVMDGNHPLSDFPAPGLLELKKEARVVSVAECGDVPSGTLGTVTRLGQSEVEVDFDSYGSVEVGRHIWKRIGCGTNAENAGSFSQIPLRPAFSLTVHRCLGLTLPEIFVDPRPQRGRPAVPGILYAALSRCPSADGVHLARSIDPSWLRVDPKAVRFCASMGIELRKSNIAKVEKTDSERNPSSMSLDEIQDELHAILRKKPMWGRVYRLIIHVERSGAYLEAGYRSFTAWLEAEAAREGVSPSLLWHRRSAGQFYEAWAEKNPGAPDLESPMLPQLNEGNLNLIRKTTSGDEARADEMIRCLINGSMATKDLRAAHAAAKSHLRDTAKDTDRLNLLAGRKLVSFEEGVVRVFAEGDKEIADAVLQALERLLSSREKNVDPQVSW